MGASQVTVLLCRAGEEGPSDYEINLQAQLYGSYWVRLYDPRALKEGEFSAMKAGPDHTEGWLSYVKRIRADCEAGARVPDSHGSLF